MIKNRSFTHLAVADIPVDTEYFRCNFARAQPVDVDGSWQGVRLFPGDNTPRIFESCNLQNCEPPPGSTLINCRTMVAQQYIETTAESVIIDGFPITTQHHSNFSYGKYNPVTESYDYFQTPIEDEVD